MGSILVLNVRLMWNIDCCTKLLRILGRENRILHICHSKNYISLIISLVISINLDKYLKKVEIKII